MPFGLHKHSNRSRQALYDAAAQGTATPSSGSVSPILASGVDEARTTQPQAFTQQARADPQPYLPPSSAADIDSGTYRDLGDLPARSQSTRYPSQYPHQAPLPTAGISSDDLTLDVRRLQQQGQRNAGQVPAVEQKKSKSLFDRMRASTSRTADQKSSAPNPASYNNTGGLARRLSKRDSSTATQNSSDHPHRLDWQAAQDSRPYLAAPQEGLEAPSELGEYLERDPGQEAPHSPVQEQGPQQTIRSVQGNPEPSPYDDARHQFVAQHQHSSSLGHPPLQDTPQQAHYQVPQVQLNIQPGSLVINDQFRSHQNAETVSQLSYESPVEQRDEQRPTSVQSNGQSPVGNYASQRQDYLNRASPVQGSRPLSQQMSMAPPGGPSQQSRRSTDPKQTAQAMQAMQGQIDARDAPPPGYRQQFPTNQPQTGGLNQPPTVVGSQGPNYRGGPPQRDQFGSTGGGDQGRSTPPLSLGDRDVNEAYKELLPKYKKVKSLYFEKTAQVEQLQNTIANQRLSQSRTSLDDSEYMTRFQRLDGATTNLAFNIRKDWRALPNWLAPYVNQEALKIGKQEMTAVGRACLTRFLVEEVFNKTFHPGLDSELSLSLKSIEQNIRLFSPPLNSQEESNALTAKVVQWRLATLDGLRDVLSSPNSDECRKQFTRVATTNLTASLINFLQDPVPPGLEDSVHMIVELAVSIAANLPLESRDISIVYPLPGDLLQPYIMKAEAGIPPLETPGAEMSSEVDENSTGSADKDEIFKDAEKGDGKTRKEKSKSAGMLQAMMGSGNIKKMSISSQGGGDGGADAKSKPAAEDGAQKVRFAGFVGVEVRGRQVLGKAPVWTVS